MEYFAITKTANGFHVEGFPDAVKVLLIAGPKIRRLADLALHKVDLDFTLECLETINTTPDEPHTLRRALWHSAIVHFIKCFGQSESRFSLDAKVVYKADPGAFEPYKYFDSLRNKNLVHDENSYTQCLPGAILNKKGMDHKIAKILCLSVVGETLGQENYQNLHLLATRARDWVVGQFDELCNLITRELEPTLYEELLAMEGITYTVPGADDVHKPRAAL
ncbi:hypothetical protein [Sphaerotilus sp.]|uniref:hypothetical protein n=1 Tax=Sphaerotilus sp. TaxID=2093942 RepID=UPI00286D8FAA|nr:hypothetical protein [Sphaerotilus sp.]